MSATKINLDRQAIGQNFTFGSTSASGQALLTLNNGTAATSNVVLNALGTVNVGGDLNLTGNLNIAGQINEQTITNLLVTDKTITVNKGGASSSGAGSGLYVEEAGANSGGILFDSTKSSGWTIGKTTQAEIVDVSSTQTLTNKSISGGQITSAVANATSATTAGNVTGVVAIANGGTGASSTQAATNALSPLTTLGDLVYNDGTNTTRLAGNTSAVKRFLVQTGTGTVSAAPGWGAIAAGDVPTLNQNTTGTAGNVTGTVVVANGGTGATTLTGVLKGNGTAAFSAATAGTDYSAGTSALSTGILKSTTTTGALSIAIASDFPTLNQNTTGTAANVTGTVAVANGGTGVTTLTGIVKASGTSAFAAAIAGTDYVVPSGSITGNSATTTSANGLTTATTTVAVSSATAPTPGQVLTATSTTAANWQTPVTGVSTQFRRTTITGTQNGTNTAFTLGNTPVANSEQIVVNGIVLNPGSGNDYTITSSSVTFAVAPVAGDIIQAFATY